MSTNDNLPEQAVKSSLSDDAKRTLIFVSVAIACVLITGIVEWVRRPAVIAEYGKMGQEFYGVFDPTKATSLEVFAFDPQSVKLQEFSVKRLESGRWVIPTHHDYPADAVEKLAKTAASMIGIKRGAMVTRWAADHARYGVVDPNQQSLAIDDVEGVGKRITLRGEDDSVLTDLVIGNKAEDKPGQYYVRKPDEDEVYIADLNIDLSTKFEDWINTDLLEVDGFDIRRLTMNDYSFDEINGTLTASVETTLTRDSGSDPWKIDGLNEETEEVNTDAVRDTVNALADLKVAGVRPKRKGLTPELRLDRTALRSSNELGDLQQELLARGFLLQPGQDGSQDLLRLLGREGELLAASDKGLVYQVYFGRAFTGSQKELEIGLEKSDDAPENGAQKKDAPAKDAAAKEKETQEEDADKKEAAASDSEDAADAAAEGDAAAKEEDSGKPGRYVFVRVEFDKNFLGQEPVKPEEPQEPAELKEAQKEGEEAAQEEPKSEGDSEEKPAEDPLEKIRQEYEDAKSKYEADLKSYEQELEEYNKKVEDGQKKAEEMNRRFAEWYYVIPGESYEKLRLSRADVVKAKEKQTEEDAADTQGTPDADAASPAGPPTTPPVMAPESADGAASTDEAPAADPGPPAAKEEAPPKSEPTAPTKVEPPADGQPPATQPDATGAPQGESTPAPQTPPANETPAAKEAPPAKETPSDPGPAKKS